MLSPILLKKRCVAAFTTMYKSPAGPPKRPASPLPGTRIREPVFTPGGRATSRLSVPGTHPSPLQWMQNVIVLPEPPQPMQVTANCRCPFDRVVLPTPLQPAQGHSREPGACPLPPQDSHACLRRTLMVALRPRRDSSKLIRIWYSRS